MNVEGAPADSTLAACRPTAAFDRGVLWVLRGIALVGLAFSLLLAWGAVRGDSAVGCGLPGGGCQDVLQSRWAHLGGVPVGFPAASLFATLLAALAFAGPKVPRALASLALRLALVLALAASGAGIWFIGLEEMVVGERCGFCLATHAASFLISAGLIIWGPLPTRTKAVCAAVGLALAGAFAGAQLGLAPPQTHQVLTFVPDPQTAPLEVGVRPTRLASGNPPRSARHVRVLGGAAEIDTFGVPVLGSRNSGLVLVVLFDYSCAPCRELRRQLAELAAHRVRGVTILALPAPRHPSCNAHVKEPLSGAANAAADCEIARLALAVWNIEPEAFGEFDAWLVAKGAPQAVEDARREAARLVGEAPLREALESNAVEELLRQFADLAEHSPARVFPQILFGDRVILGSFANAYELKEVLIREGILVPD